MSDLFTAPSIEQSAQELADHLPQGRAWDIKNDPDSNTRKLLRSLAASYNQVEQKIQELHEELDVNKTLSLLEEWEKSVLLPDSCLGDIDDIEERRALVIRRLQKKAIVNLQEFQDIVNEFFPGFGIILKPGAEVFTFEYDLEMPLIGTINEKFILVVEVNGSNIQFEYDLELPLGGGPNIERLRCFIEEFLPANVYLYFIFRG